MRKLIFLLALPASQVAVAWSLLNWNGGYSPYLGNTRAFCFAINAPIMLGLAPFYAGAPNHWMPSNILGLRSDNFLILIAVAMLWGFVGISFLRFRRQRQRVMRLDVVSGGPILLNVLLAICGTWLFFKSGMDWILRTDSGQRHAIFDVIDGIIAVLWSLFIVSHPVKWLITLLKRRPAIPLTR